MHWSWLPVPSVENLLQLAADGFMVVFIAELDSKSLGVPELHR